MKKPVFNVFYKRDALFAVFQSFFQELSRDEKKSISW